MCSPEYGYDYPNKRHKDTRVKGFANKRRELTQLAFFLGLQLNAGADEEHPVVHGSLTNMYQT